MSVRMVVDVRVKPGTQDELVPAYRELVETASLQPGLSSTSCANRSTIFKAVRPS